MIYAKYENKVLNAFMKMYCKGEIIYIDNDVNAIGCGKWVVKLLSATPFQLNEGIGHLSVDKILKNTPEGEDVTIRYTDSVGTVLTNDNGLEITVDSKLLQLFPDCTFKATSSRDPLHILYNDNFIGILMPIRR